MKHVRLAVRALFAAVLCCAALSGFAFAEAADNTAWVTLSKTANNTTAAQIVSNAAVTDGVVELTYNSDTLTYQDVEVDEAHVAMYSVNADESGVVRVSWVAPDEGSAIADGAMLFQVNFAGAADAEDVTLSGTINGADGSIVPIDGDTKVIPVDKSALKAQIDAAKALKSENYTAESWEALEQALQNAKSVYDNKDAAQSEVDAAAKALGDAIAALVPVEPAKVDKDALKAQIDAANKMDQSKYTEASWKNMQDALEQAKKIYDDPNATQEQVNAVLKALTDALNSLTVKPSSATSVKTGDNAKVALAVGAAVCAAAAGCAVLFMMKKKEANR